MKITGRIVGFFFMVFLLCKGDGCGGKAEPPVGPAAATDSGPSDPAPNETQEEVGDAVSLSTVTKVHVGKDVTCASLADASVMCWGRRAVPGNMSPTGSFWDSVAYAQVSFPEKMEGLSGVVAMGLGPADGTHCALQTDGAVKCWGYGSDYAAGVPTPGWNAKTAADNFIWEPTTVPYLTNKKIALLAPGGNTNIAVGSMNVVHCWGRNNGKCGNGVNYVKNATAPKVIPALAGVWNISSLWSSGCGIFGGGEVKCWGKNLHGEVLGATINAVVDYNTEPATTVAGITGAKDIAVCFSEVEEKLPLPPGAVFGYEIVPHVFSATCAIVGEVVKCWGTMTDYWGFDTQGITQVDGLTGIPKSIVAGAGHFCVLLDNGDVQCWGRNDVGQRGEGTTNQILGNAKWKPDGKVDLTLQSATFTKVTGITGAIQIAASGGQHTCALLEDKTIKCWGGNTDGQLGDGTTIDRHTPVPVLVGP